MNTLPQINLQSLNRALVGFDQLFTAVDGGFANQVNKSTYPPYNIIKHDDDYAIEMAVAGFKKDEIVVEVLNDQLIIKGTQTEREDTIDVQYLHRGLSARDFTRNFTLAEHMIVQGAVIQDGILRVGLQRIVPEEKKPRLINIQEVK